jgi:outer membrane protein TolC
MPRLTPNSVEAYGAGAVKTRFTSSRALRLLTLAIVCLASAESLFAQAATDASPLSLQQAVAISLEKNPLRKAAAADTRAASAGVREARSFLLPHLNFSESATRGDDPVYVFGSKLRQRRFTANDFTLNRLNTPLPYGNFATRFGGSWSLFDSFASWHGVSRAKLMDKAAAHQLDRTDQEILFHVVQAYYGALLAAKQLEVAGHAEQTAKSILDRSQTRFDSGLVVESDLLSAKVRLAGREQELIRARNNVALGRAELNVAMGVPADSPYQVVGAQAERDLPLPVLPELEQKALATRPDLKRIDSEQAAQQQSVSIAKASFGPRVSAFAGWEMDNPTFVAGGGGNNWLGGIEVQFDLFQGGAKKAALARERAVAERIASLKQAAGDHVHLEVRQAYYEQDSSRQQVGVARDAIAQAQESLRINQERYDAGLITITDLLGAEDAARRTQADYWTAVYQFRISYANLELASGTLTPQSPVVMP